MKRKLLTEGTVILNNPAYIRGFGTAVGSEEANGPLGEYFDITAPHAEWGQGSFERAEKKLYMEAAKFAISKAGLSNNKIDFMLGGDLLNQIISAAYSARDLDIPFLGLYGACSCMSESLAIGSMLIDGGFADNILCATSSHFATAERQFRNPLELGTPKPPTGQDTVTGAGATILTAEEQKLGITSLTIGRIVDLGIPDANNMGAAMAPAAAQSIMTHLENRGVDPDYYDGIYTGDLGIFGTELLEDLCMQYGVDIADTHRDCGMLIYAGMEGKHSGASGCGCSAAVLNGYLLKRMSMGKYDRILFCATGALHSPTSVLQGESIPGICHVVEIERLKK